MKRIISTLFGAGIYFAAFSVWAQQKTTVDDALANSRPRRTFGFSCIDTEIQDTSFGVQFIVGRNNEQLVQLTSGRGNEPVTSSCTVPTRTRKSQLWRCSAKLNDVLYILYLRHGIHKNKSYGYYIDVYPNGDPDQKFEVSCR